MASINRINILPPDVYNLIAAGEVVERPSSAVKELVENSIDAGARRITIEIKNGGYDLISVSDNGCGIFEDDIEAAFVKHATSKLLLAEDLNSIQTLGFRGEALSSIAAVSRVKLTTRQAQSDVAVCVQVEGGEIVSREMTTANVGTRIEVRDLYYNVPARRKFMKEGNRESSDITKFVSKLILTNPNLEITYIVDDKNVYQTKGNGLSECIFTVYGSKCLEYCIPINYEAQFLRITGYVGNPEYSKPNTTYQTLSVNGRCVSDKSIQGAINRAFQPYLMSRQFPFFVLDLSIPCDLVDVNVHPRKTEVRFENVNFICGKFFRAVSEVLREYTTDKVDLILDGSMPYVVAPEEEEHVSELWKNVPDAAPAQYEALRQIENQTRISQKKPLKEFAEELERTLTVQGLRRALGMPSDVKNDVAQPMASIAPPTSTPVIEEDEIGRSLIARTRVLGALFKTYLILELDDKLILVDQHAAHERMLFDKFMAGKATDMQPVMFPYVFKVRSDEADFIERNIPNILKAGIEVEPFGENTFRICAVSTLLADTEMEDFVKYLLSEVEEFEVDDRLIVEKIAKKACKAAVKAGYMLSEMEIRHILKSIYENKILQCPHGRPITVVYSKSQIEKTFKRIV